MIHPCLSLGQPRKNAETILTCVEKSVESGAQLCLLPELSLTGYTCADWFYQEELQAEADQSLALLVEQMQGLPVVVVLGSSLRHQGRLFNVAVVVVHGELLGVVPKQYMPNRAEYYEPRWFTSGEGVTQQEVTIAGQRCPFGTDLLFSLDGTKLCFGIEICEDLWAPCPPSGQLCMAGANLILNPSASNEILGKLAYRRELVKQQSARCLAAYAYASAGPNESSTDLVFGGHCLITENGQILAESERFVFESHQTLADIDLQQLEHERLRNSSFAQSKVSPFRVVKVQTVDTHKSDQSDQRKGLLRPNPRHPFVPNDPAQRASSCAEIIRIQSTGLSRRMKHLANSRIILGISGGLDSTLALIVAVQACDQLKVSRSTLLAVTMPGSGTTERTRSNAEQLAKALGVELRVIPIGDVVAQHLRDLNHPEGQFDTTYENAQARERTQILMDLANQEGGFVLGTGDLSEAALGWCTFNGDQMSMYHVNIGVPKTLIQYLIRWYAEEEAVPAVKRILLDILDTPITPELLPLNNKGEQDQQTEQLIGPYELHDFFLYHRVRHGRTARRILELATEAFEGDYSQVELKRWWKVFDQRFVQQQFKRSAMPDGPKVGSVSLSPRGDWRMPSDLKKY